MKILKKCNELACTNNTTPTARPFVLRGITLGNVFLEIVAEYVTNSVTDNYHYSFGHLTKLILPIFQ